MDGADYSRRLSHQGAALVCAVVIGGTVIFFGMVHLYRLIYRLFYANEQGSTMPRESILVNDPIASQIPTVFTDVAVVSHFSPDS